MNKCIFPSCYRTATVADWCHAHTPRSWRPTMHPSMQPAAIDAPNLFALPDPPEPHKIGRAHV